ncbi:MAG: DUF4982 domain-containing protein [Betaproteobacteria bacterium]|nr:DUF4982 domain-containing protein [Betaproteobacteria bacterium]
MSNTRLFPLTFLLLVQTVLSAIASDTPRERISLDAGWRFTKGDSPDTGTNLEHAAIRPEKEAAGAFSFAQPDFNDSQWRLLNLPHDWGIEGPFRAELPNATGKLPWAGIGWYRKTLTLGEADHGRRIFLDFDGAMSHPKVFVNGKLAGEWAYGYSSFRVEITDFVKFDGANIVAVRLDNPPDSSRWYPGGGIYRHVWLEKTSPIHVARWGVFVHTPMVSQDEAEVVVETTVNNQSPQTVDITVRQELLAPDSGKVLALGEMKLAAVTANTESKAVTKLSAEKPQLWDITLPKLHTMRTIVLAGGQEVDRVETPFGIRKIEWNAKQGFLLNGHVLKLQGVCNHSDLGALGMAFNERAAERQLEILRAMGDNAIRTSHNPPAPQLLDLCDRMGFVVMDELFDCWKKGKTPNDYHLDYDAWHERDVANFVHRDRNHPSVILWSSGNEIKEQAKKDDNHERSRHLTELFHRADPTRPVAAGMHNDEALTNGFAQTVDVAGYNYKPIATTKPKNWLNPKTYLDHIRHAPDQPFVGAETASTLSSRGVYFFPVSSNKDGGFFQFQVSSYDHYGPPWANSPDIDFDSADRLPGLAGEFVWTGFDYLGEPTPYNKDKSNLLNFQNEAERAAMKAEMDRLGNNMPSRSSYFGIIDIAGFPKDRYYLYQSRWRPDFPMTHILPHWNWPERVGQVTPVYVYTSGDAAELFLNGKSLGMKKKNPFEYRLRWEDVVYQPGELKVVAYKNGKNWATDTVKTTGVATQLTLTADRNKIAADGKDLAFITVTVADQAGLQVPRSKNHIKFEVEGPGEIVATDNGDATSFESFQAPEHNAYNGLALVIVRAQSGQIGTFVLKATSPDLKPSAIKIRTF